MTPRRLLRQHAKDVARVLRHGGLRSWSYRPALWETRAWLRAIEARQAAAVVARDEKDQR